MTRVVKPALVLALTLGLAAIAVPAAAQPRAPGPWVPPDADSVAVWSAQVRAAFRAQDTDSLTDAIRPAYDRVSVLAWRWMWSMGRERTREAAPAIERALDSLGFAVDLVGDPGQPQFHFLTIRNPHRVTSRAMGVFLWWRGDRLLRQGIALTGGHTPSFRVWWTNDAAGPYGWALIDVERDGTRRFHSFTLSPDGGFWQPRQWPGRGPDLTGIHATTWSEVNGDTSPELIGWERLPPDTLFTECGGCPARLGSRMWIVRGREGFVLQESRVVAGPYETFTAFIRALVDGDRAGASRRVARPEMVADAIRRGWNARKAPATWTLEQAEDERWPRWLGVRYQGRTRPERYVVRFREDHGRWLIEQWADAARPDTVRARDGR